MAATTVENPGVLIELRSPWFRSAVAALLLASSGQSIAADWKLVPTIGLNETYTDNVRLSADGKQESAYITQVSPGLTINATGQRLKLQANYVMQNSYYSGDTNETKTNHLLRSNANVAFVQNLFFLDANANITQQNLTPFGQVTDNDFTLSKNRVEVRTYSASPYFRRNFDNKFIGELRYSYDSVASSAQTNADSTSDTFRFNLNSGQAFKTTNWGLSYSQQNVHFERQATLESAMATLNFDYYISPLFRLTSTAGHEKNSYVSLAEKRPGYFGTFGFAWVPNQRTSLIFNAGDRFYGKTYALTLSQRARLSVWSLGYNEDVTTTRGQFLLPATNNTSAFLDQLWQTTIPDAASRQKTVDNFIRDSGLPAALSQPVNTFTNQVFLQRSLQGSVGLTGARNTVVLSVFNNLREPLSTGGVDAILNPGLLRKVRQTGTNALWNVQFSPRTNASFSAAYSKAKTVDTTLEDDTKTFRASISRMLQPKLKGSLELRHLQRDSSVVTGNYKENAITLYLFLGF